MTDRRSLFLGLVLLFMPSVPTPALAQQANDNNVRIQGLIQQLDGQTLIIQTADGKPTTLHVTADTVFTRNEAAALTDIKPGDYVASAAVTGSDGKLHSLEVRIFPQALAGLGEGQRPMQDKSKTMTNAAVSEVVATLDGQVLKVNFHGSTSELVVGPGVPIIRVLIANSGDLPPGAKVFVTAMQQADGSLNAARVLAQ